MGNVRKYPQKPTSTFMFLRGQATLYNVGLWFYNQNMLAFHFLHPHNVAIPVYTRLFLYRHGPGYTWGMPPLVCWLLLQLGYTRWANQFTWVARLSFQYVVFPLLVYRACVWRCLFPFFKFSLLVFLTNFRVTEEQRRGEKNKLNREVWSREEKRREEYSRYRQEE